MFALAVAMLMNQKLKLIPFYRTLYYIPTLLGGSVAIAVLWRQLFAGDGVINAILRLLFRADPPSWISNPKYALYTLILLAVWQFGSPMIIFLAGLKQIPSGALRSRPRGRGRKSAAVHLHHPAGISRRSSSSTWSCR